MTARPTLLFVHGWAFDASVWTPLRAALSDWPQAVFDAGYFGAGRGDAGSAPDAPVIAIGHSMGVLRLLRDLPGGCAGLVSINGFARFSAAPDFDAGVPVRMLDRMIKRLSADPAAVVQDFRLRCGESNPSPTPQLAPLARDLQALRDEDQRGALAALPIPVLILAGQDDPIVPMPMTQAVFENRAADERHVRADGGHLLPISHTDWCARHIAAFIERVVPSA